MTDFATAYERVLGQWPDVEVSDVDSPYGSTRILSAGPVDAPPVLLLPGGGATATVWFANAAALAAQYRVHALDLPGDAGHTRVSVRDAGELCDWLAAVTPSPAGVVGHSYGAWVALTYALRSPERVRRLALLDPTNVFDRFSQRYLLHAVPTLLRPTPRRTAALLRWETGGRALDPAWAELAAAAIEQPRTGRLVFRPKPDVRRLAVPTLVLVAGRSRAHRPDAIAAAAGRVPGVRVGTIADASHHSLPADPAPEVNAALLSFLD